MFKSIAQLRLSNIKQSRIIARLRLYKHLNFLDDDVNVYYVMLYEILYSPMCTVGGFSTFLCPKISSFSRTNFSNGYRLFSSTTESTANDTDPW